MAQLNNYEQRWAHATTLATIGQGFQVKQWSLVTLPPNIVSNLHFDYEGRSFFPNLAYHRNFDMLLRCCLPQLTVLYEHVQMQRKRWWFLNLQILCWISILTSRVNHFFRNLAYHRNLDMLLRCCLPQLTVLYSTVRVCVQMQRKRWWFLNLQILKIQRFFRKNPH